MRNGGGWGRLSKGCAPSFDSSAAVRFGTAKAMALLSWGRERFRPVLRGKLLASLVFFRVLNALVVRTSFTPDEFWQGPEPAHLLAFGTGHL